MIYDKERIRQAMAGREDKEIFPTMVDWVVERLVKSGFSRDKIRREPNFANQHLDYLNKSDIYAEDNNGKRYLIINRISPHFNVGKYRDKLRAATDQDIKTIFILYAGRHFFLRNDEVCQEARKQIDKRLHKKVASVLYEDCIIHEITEGVADENKGNVVYFEPDNGGRLITVHFDRLDVKLPTKLKSRSPKLYTINAVLPYFTLEPRYVGPKRNELGGYWHAKPTIYDNLSKAAFFVGMDQVFRNNLGVEVDSDKLHLFHLNEKDAVNKCDQKELEQLVKIYGKEAVDLVQEVMY